MDRIKRYVDEVMGKHGNLFGSDYEENKEVLSRVSKVQSKWLRNRIAGYITSMLRDESEEKGKVEGETVELAEVQSP